jgi:hypothetical protein
MTIARTGAVFPATYRGRIMALEKYQLTDLPEEEVRPVLDAPLRYLPVYICMDSMKNFASYEIRRRRPR